MANRRWGLHSGKLTANQATIKDTLTVNGNLTFGDASTDTLTVTGLSTFSAAMDINTTMDVDVSSTTNVVDIVNSGTGDVVKVANSATNTGATKALLELEGTSTASTAVPAGLLIDMNGTGDAGIGLEIDDEATGNSNPTLQIASAKTGIIAQLNAEGAATVGLDIDMADGSTGAALAIDHNETDGNAVGIEINMATTGATAFAFDLIGIATNAGIIQTDSVTTDMAIDNALGVIRIRYDDGGGAATGYIPIISTFI